MPLSLILLLDHVNHSQVILLAVVANATTGNDMVTATNTTTRKWTKWITARESVVKVPYIRTTDEKLLHSLTSIRQLGNQLRVCAKNKKCRDWTWQP
jgi:hypothetical protein